MDITNSDDGTTHSHKSFRLEKLMRQRLLVQLDFYVRQQGTLQCSQINKSGRNPPIRSVYEVGNINIRNDGEKFGDLTTGPCELLRVLALSVRRNLF